MDRYRLGRADAALLVIDVQERLCAAMEPKALERMVRRTCALIAGARALALPVVITEQYPKGLGATIPPVRSALDEQGPIEKVNFSCALEEVLAALGPRRQVLIAGMETHVCVFQTARDLAQRGYHPYLCADAVISRSEEDRRIGLDLCKDVGAVVTSVEAALFDLLGRAGSAEFKAISAAVR
ncbi:MAG: isochorismatase family protein [Myxococcales bacterium]|nr:isochorismatase family protein [Myxococcales bacterium]